MTDLRANTNGRTERLAFAAESYVIVLDGERINLGAFIRAQANHIATLEGRVEMLTATQKTVTESATQAAAMTESATQAAPWQDTTVLIGKPGKDDPDGMNEERAIWALAAIEEFEGLTGTERENAVADLLCDLMHWSHQTGTNFVHELTRAASHFEAETNEEGV